VFTWIFYCILYRFELFTWFVSNFIKRGSREYEARGGSCFNQRWKRGKESEREEEWEEGTVESEQQRR
jgi:hypothetical protein